MAGERLVDTEVSSLRQGLKTEEASSLKSPNICNEKASVCGGGDVEVLLF